MVRSSTLSFSPLCIWTLGSHVLRPINMMTVGVMMIGVMRVVEMIVGVMRVVEVRCWLVKMEEKMKSYGKGLKGIEVESVEGYLWDIMGR